MIFEKKKILVWCDDPPEDRVISIVAGCLANHDRAHSQQDPRIPKSTGMTFIFTGVRLLGSRVAGFRVFELTFGDHFGSHLEISHLS
jgi:hypothetical protein